MAQSLLAHMYSHIRGSQEDIATYSIEHIVSSSPELNKAFTGMLETALHEQLGESIRYNCQATGKQMERPDISGINPDGKEVVLCEAKFYAGLTDNQPNTYLDRLKEENGIGLVFICPAKRKEGLWRSLINLCGERKLEQLAEYCVSVDEVRMSIITWDEIFETLRRTAASTDPASMSDIYQFESFCKLMDDSAFIPFKGEDFGPENARKEERHYQVMDSVVTHLLADKTLGASTNRLKATAYRNGYVRYIIVLNHALAVAYDRQNWSDPATEETPFWLTINERDFKQPIEYQQIFKKYPASYRRVTSSGPVALPLFAQTGYTLDEVAKDIKDQIVSYIKDLDTSLNKEMR